MAKRKILSCALSALLGLSTVFGGVPVAPSYVNEEAIAAVKETTTVDSGQEVTAEDTQVDAGDYGLAGNIQDGTILHCFDWKYSDIKDEIPNIAAAGFTSVQTSPAQKGDGQVWYWLYQPQTFSIQSNALGTKAELQALCAEAQKYGVKVIVDVVANHTRAEGDDGLGSDCYHHDGDAWYTDRYGITHGKIGMPDLNSESSTVQNKVKGYIEELKGAGVEGIRWDAAKHIGLPSEDCQFWPVVTSVGLYNYGEILVGPTESGGDDLMKEYTNYMSVTDSKYGQAVREAFEGGGVPSSIGNWSERGVAKKKLVYWGESHDTYSNNGEYGEATQLIDQNKIDRAYAVVAAQGQATSLYFSRPYQTDKQQIKAGDKGSTHFTSKEVAAVNHLHNNCVGEKDYYVNGGSAAAVCRESGAVIVKGSGSGHVDIKNGGGTTAAGTYTDEVSGGTWTVTADTISGDVGESGIAVIYKSKGSSGGNTGGGGTVTKTTAPVQTTTPSNNSTTVSENTIVATMPSGWSDLYIYAYQPGATATKLTGEWPGTKMTAGSDGKYTYTMASSVTSAKVIFASSNGSQDPSNVPGQDCGFDYVGGKAYSYDGGKWSELTISKATETTKAPEKTAEPEKTTTPTKAPTKTETPSNETIQVSVADKSSFDTETLKVKITLNGEKEGTYIVDDGPERSFKSGDSVTLGEGKIADTDVTLKVKSGSETKTFTYTKEFNADTAVVKSVAVTRIQSIFEVVADATQTDAAAETGGMYATNPSGYGKESTITIDGDCSDWSSDMLVAQCGAWDVANVWKGGHENCLTDCYGLYAAWDDSNLYVGMEMVNTTDTWCGEGKGPLLDNGKPGDLPIMLAINTGTENAMTGLVNDGKGVWGLNVQFETRIDHLCMMSAKVGQGEPSIFTAADSTGAIDYLDKTHTVAYKDAGIAYKCADNSVSAQLMQLVNSQAVTDAYDASMYSDAVAAGHNRKYDSFYEISIPLDALGITKSDIESNGVGIMQVATRGQSAIDCIPHDPSMLDNVDGDYSQDPSTSEEKEDLDIITVPLAAVGNANAGGSGGSTGGGGTATKTTAPTKTETPEKTSAASKTDAPSKTEKPSSSVYTVNFGADYSSPQYDSRKLTLKAVPYNGKEDYTYEFSVDDKVVQEASSKDSYSWKGESGKHTIKVVVEDGSGKKITSEKNFEIQSEDSDEPEKTEAPNKTTTPTKTSTPTPTKTGTLAPIKTGTPEPEKTTTPAKTGTPTPTKTTTPNKTATPTKTTTPAPTQKVTNTVAPAQTANPGDNSSDSQDDSKQNNGISIKLSKKDPSVVSSVAGKKITFYMSAEGGSGSYTYRFEVINSSNKKNALTVKKSSVSAYEKQAAWTPSKTGTYTVRVTVTDSDGYYNTRSVSYKVTTPVKVSTFKASKTSVKKGKKIKFTVKASSISAVKYRFRLQKVGSKTIKTLRGYSTKKTYTYKTTKKGKYYVYLQVKDTDRNTKTVKKKITVK